MTNGDKTRNPQRLTCSYSSLHHSTTPLLQYILSSLNLTYPPYTALSTQSGMSLLILSYTSSTVITWRHLLSRQGDFR